MRDLSYLLDLYFAEYFGNGFFHFHNVVLWLFCLFTGYKLLLRLGFEQKQSRPMVFLFGIYPLFSMCIPWVSSRKHLLAFFFILLSWLFFEIYKQKGQTKHLAYLLLLYLLSSLSQPIYTLFPLWAGLDWFYFSKKPRHWFFIPYFLLMLFLIYFHYDYYADHYQLGQRAQDLNVLNSINGLSVGTILLKMGRLFFQFIFPFRLAITYDSMSPYNYVGIIFFISYFIVLAKALGPKVLLKWISLIMVSSTLWLFKVRSIFLSDTYLLLGAFGHFILMALLLKKLNLPAKAMTALITFFISIFSFTTFVHAKQFTNERQLWEQSFDKEPTCQSAHVLAVIYYQAFEIDKALKFSNLIIKELRCFLDPKLGHRILENTLFFTDEFDWNQKQLFMSKRPTSVSKSMFMAAILIEQGFTDKGLEQMGTILRDPLLKIERPSTIPILRVFRKNCSQSTHPTCDKIELIFNSEKKQ